MRKLLAFVAAVFLAAWGLPQSARGEVTVDVFYQSLEPHGEWIETADYGYIWHPRDVDEGWRPYTVGHWVYTDAGWTWVSEEPFGWATYHYGRWIELERVGWAWVPDTEWGPAWVSWRRSPKYVGWAPLPPEASFRRTVGIKTWSDAYYDVGPTYYSFVEVRQFGSPELQTVILPPQQNVTIIRETRNITNITVVNNVIFNGGPEYDVIVRESVQPIRRLRLDRRTDVAFDRARPDMFRARIEGDSLQFAAPEIRYVRDARPERVARRLEKVNVDRGWEDLKAPQAQQLRAAIKQEAKPPAELPAEPKFERLAERSERRAQDEGVAAPGAEDATKPGRERERATAGRERPMKEGGTVGTPDAAAPSSAAAGPDSKAATKPEPATKPDKPQERPDTERSRRPGERSEGETATPTEEQRKKQRGEARREESKPGRADRQERMRGEADQPGRPSGSSATPGVKTPSESAATPAEPGATKPAEAKADEKPERAGRDRKAKPAEAEKEDSRKEDSRKEGAKPAQREREAAPAQVPDVSTEQSPARSERKPAASPERGGRSDRPERPNRGEAEARPEAATRQQSADRPERSRPAERPERDARPERPARSEQADRPGGGAATRSERPNRPDRPEPQSGRGGQNAPSGGGEGSGGRGQGDGQGGGRQR